MVKRKESQVLKAIFFDVDNTLLDFEKSANITIEKIFRNRGLPFSQEVTIKMFHKVNAELWGRIENGTLTEERLHKKRWNIILERLGIEDVNGIEIEREFFFGLRENVVNVDGAEQLLSSLYGRYALYVTSNANHEQQLIRLENAGLLKYIKEVFTAESIGHAKPDKAFFEGCFKRIPDLKKEHVLIVGDSLAADIEGGNAFGLKTVWYCPDKEKAEQTTVADFVVNSLSQIKEIL